MLAAFFLFIQTLMENLTLLASICAIHTLALISPGPDFILALKNSITYSRKTGIYTAIGFALGIATHLLYCITGLAFLISQSIIIFNIIKYLGAAYLIYIGFKSFTSKSAPVEISTGENSEDTTKKADITSLQAIKSGYLTNLFNPKATMYMLALFTMVIKPGTPIGVIVAASAYIVLATMAWFSLVAVFFSQKRVQNFYLKFQKAINRTFGGLLMLLGIKIALTKE
jgi:RhtB (resistance to homoserine/threonine) family protein